ncbi:FRP1_2 [Sanghuangporus weigelae]
MADAPPSVPPEFQFYNSHKIDPIYQRRFTITWVSVSLFFITFALPSFIRSLRIGRVRDALVGLRKSTNAYEPVDAGREASTSHSKENELQKANNLLSLLNVSAMWTISFLKLDVGQIILILGYFVLVIVCFTLRAELIENPNRPGFLAVAQLPLIFLLAMKNSALAILLSSGYEKLNFLHRWCSRGVILAAAVHGFLWMRNHIAYGLPIIRKRKDVTGIIAFALLCILGLTSVRPVRARVFQIFRVIHLLSVPAFAIAMRYHTRHTIPYLYPSLALWGFDLLLRLFRMRMRTATLIAPDAQMTIVRIHDCVSGWTVGQHVRLRVFFPHRMLESHALTIMNAPQTTTCLVDAGFEQELILGARVSGDWSRALNAYTRRRNALSVGDADEEALSPTKSSKFSVASEAEVEDGESIHLSELPVMSKSENASEALLSNSSDWSPADHGTSVQVMLDGPYGGCSIDVGTFEHVLFVAGGSGVTFTLSLLDDLVGRCLKLGRRNGEVTRRVAFTWCIRSLSALHWVSPLLSTIASRTSTSDSTVDLHITIHVTRASPSDEETPDIPFPNCDIIFTRPTIREIIDDFASTREAADAENPGASLISSGREWESLAICAAGPESLTNETKNSAARLALRNPRRRIGSHTETFFL